MTARPTGNPATRPAPWAFAAPWGAKGWITDLAGPVHWIEFTADTGDGVPIVFVHGLGGSHLNWVLVGPRLARGRRAFALDLRGFGLTPGAPRSTSVRANVRLLDAFLREVVGGPAVLVGNSMGGLISTLQADARPESVAGLVLVDPALPPIRQRPDPMVAATFLTYVVPGFGEMYLRFAQSRMSSDALVRRVIELCFADPAKADPAMLAAGVALADERRTMRGKEESFLRATRSLMWILGAPDNYRALLGRIGAPVLLVHGTADRLVPIAAAGQVAAANPLWDTTFLSDVGHTPQLETPELVSSAILGWLARTPTITGG